MSKNLSAKYYQKNKERQEKKKLTKDMKIFLTKKKKKSRQYGCECNKNLLEDEKQKLAEYRKKYHRTRKNVSF